MSKCPKCKANISDKSVEYCPECGTRVRKIETIKKVIVEKELKEKETSRTITAGLIISWIVGAYLIFSGIETVLGFDYSKVSFLPKYLYHLTGIIELCIGVLILPITNKYLETKLNIKFSRGLKIFIVIGYVIFSIIIGIKYAIKQQPTFLMPPWMR